MATASLAVRVSAQIAEFQSAFKDMSKTVDKFAGDFEGMATRASAVGTFFGNIATDIAKSLASGLAGAIRDAVKFSSEFSNAFIGLSSVASAFGTSADAAKDAAKRLSQDGLLPVKDAATGLKNLLAAGFSLPEATKLMNAFKDSAAFGRQSALSFGDAVRSATEGVKNGNSILVDNAGITKNLSQILKEAGFSAQDLSKASSDAGVRQALFNGILKEAAAFAGDAERATQTYTGQVSRLDTAYSTLLASIGDAVTQNKTVGVAIGFVSDQMTALTQRMTGTKQGLDLVSRAVIFVVRGFGEALNVVDLIQTEFASLQIMTNKVMATFTAFAARLFRVAEGANDALKFLEPQKWKEHTAAANDARKVYTFLEGAVKGFGDASKDAENRSAEMGNSLQGVRARIDELATKLEATRGQTIEFGKSGTTAGSALGEGISAGATKAKKALESFQETLNKIGGPHKIGLAQEVGIDLNLKLAFPSEIALQQQIQDGITKITSGMRGFTMDIETEVRLPTVTLPPTFYQQLFNPAEMGLAIGNAISAAIQGGGNVLAAGAGALGQGLTTNLAKYLTAAKDVGGKAISGFLGGAINAVLPGLGALLGPLTSKIVDVFAGLFNRHKGRDLVEDFAAGFGGFNALHEQLNALEGGGEKFWIALTQGVGRNNPDQARAAIEMVTAALEAQKKKQAEAAVAAQDASKVMVDAQNAATAGVKARISELGNEYDRLWNSIKDEAPEDVMGIVEQQTRERMAAVKTEQEGLGEILKGIAKMLAEQFDKVGPAAEQAARDIEEAMKHIRIETIRIPIEVGGVPELGSGGIAMRRTLAVVGDEGPEAIVPLDKFGAGVSNKATLQKLAAIESILKRQPDVMFRAIRDARAFSG